MQQHGSDTAKHNKGIIFSDIDGTFLDGEYHVPFSPDFLREVFSRYDIVFTSSRTIEEILLLQQTLSHRAPFIAENGGAIVFYDEPLKLASLGHFETLFGERIFIIPLGYHALDILPFVKSAAATTGIYTENIAKMSLESIAHLSNYAVHDAYYAQKRRYSVTVSAIGLEKTEMSRLTKALEQLQCSVSHGGKWLNITRGSDKGLAVEWYQTFLRREGVVHKLVAAIGNDSNDMPMLKNVDLPFVIRNSSGYSEALSALPGAHLLQSEGVSGWIEMFNFLDDIPHSALLSDKQIKPTRGTTIEFQ
ncbi:MAG: HAD hydrolase family protein [Candidatus Kapabacteria bacterium]|jgi:mannosyl-3-phosphoglycerate phosphatase family protein|nr:HAD hydrolase family protein [Candidatus Kapabacteria bacterium]